MPGKSAKTKEKDTEKAAAQENTLHVNAALPSVFADKVQLLMRKDGLAVLRWIQDLPEFSSEVCRVLVTQDHLKRIIDMLCRTADYYPNPEKSDGKG